MDWTIPPEFERAVRERLSSGLYGSADEVFLAALRALEFVETELDTLRREVQVGMDQVERGQVVDGEEAIAWLKERIGRRVRR